MKLIILFFCFLPHAFSSENFSELVSQLIDADPDFLKVENQKRYQKHNKLSAQTKLFLPSLDLNFSKSNQNSIYTNVAIEGSTSQLEANYSLFNFGSDYLNYQAQNSYYQAYHQELNQTLIVREFTIIKLLLLKVKATKNILIQNSIIELKQKSFDISQKRFRRGALSKNDHLRVKLDLANARSELINLRADLYDIESKLAGYRQQTKIANFPWTAFFELQGIKKISELNFTPEQNPDLQRYQHLKLANDQYASSRARTHLGRFSLNYSRTRYLTEDNQELYGYSASLVYTLPLFENFDRSRDIQQAKANARTAQAIYSYQKTYIEAQAANKKDLLQLTYQNFVDRLDTLKDANSLFNNVLERFQKGELSVNELLVEQDRLLKTKQLSNAAIYNLHISYLEVLHLHGKAFIRNPKYFN